MPNDVLGISDLHVVVLAEDWREHEGYTVDFPATLDDLGRPTDSIECLVKLWQ
jgi:hypothetical protein